MRKEIDAGLRPQCLDIIGKEITAGCFVIYAVNLGRCAGLCIGQIQSVKAFRSEYGRKEIEWAINVRGMERNWHFDRATNPWRLKKIGTLQFPDRITVIDQSDITPDQWAVFNEAK